MMVSQIFRSFIAVLSVALLVSALGQANAQTPAFDTIDDQTAHDVLPRHLLLGDHFQVNPLVVSYGYQNWFVIHSDFGTFEAHGNAMVPIRIGEIWALAEIEKIKNSKAFATALKSSIKAPFLAAKSLVMHPVDTLTGVPKGAYTLIRRLGNMVTDSRGDLEDSRAKEIIGISDVKRKYAHKLGVNVYSDNKKLQKELNRVAWASFAGGLPVAIGTMGAGIAARTVITTLKASKTLNDTMRDTTPEDLRKANRTYLIERGVAKDEVERFLALDHFSPRHQTAIVQSLSELPDVGSPELLIRQCFLTEDTEGAFFVQQTAELMSAYNKRVAKIIQFGSVNNILVFLTETNKAVFTLPVDTFRWTEQSSANVRSILGMLKSVPSVQEYEVWITGQATERARQNVKALGVTLIENAAATLLPGG